MNKLKQIWAAATAAVRNVDTFVQLRAEIARLETDNRRLKYSREALESQLNTTCALMQIHRREALAAESTLTAIKNHVIREPSSLVSKRFLLTFFKERTL